MIDFFSNIFEHFIDPRKRVFVGYLAISILIALIWLVFFKRVNLKSSLKFIFNKNIWFSSSSKADFFVFLINRIISISISPVLITQLVIATAIFYWLHEISWLSSGSFPKYTCSGLFFFLHFLYFC